MLSENCEKVVLKSVQRKFYKTVIDLEIEEKDFNILNEKNEMIIDMNK